MDPFAVLLDIERNCRAFAVKIPRQMEAERDWLGIGFRSSHLNFVCPMNLVSEILKWPTITGVPAAQPWFKGTTNLRGHILPVTDLQEFVTGKPASGQDLGRILVISYDKAIYGFAVPQVLGIERFFGEEMKPIVEMQEIKEYLPYVQGGFEIKHQPWIILDFSIIIQTPEFYHVLSNHMEGA